jgi:threonine synthase
VLMKLIDRQVLSKKDRTIVISTAHGLKFSEFKVGYHEGTLADVNCKYSNKPIALPPDIGKIKEALEREFAARA